MELKNDFMNNESDPIAYRKAKRKVRAMKGFYSNLMAYLLVIPMLIAINITYSPEFYWFFFPMLGWGIGLAFHGMAVFNFNPFFGRNWENRKILELIEKERNNRHNLDSNGKY